MRTPWISRRTRRALARDRRGNVAVEFALIAPILIGAVAGIIEYGNILHTQQMMQYASGLAARCYAVGTCTSATAITTATTFLSGSSSLSYTVTVTEAAGATGQEVTVTVSVPLADAALINVLTGILGTTAFSGNLQANTTMRVES
jgi:Flp pilus assembly protein TadG